GLGQVFGGDRHAVFVRVARPASSTGGETTGRHARRRRRAYHPFVGRRRLPVAGEPEGRGDDAGGGFCGLARRCGVGRGVRGGRVGGRRGGDRGRERGGCGNGRGSNGWCRRLIRGEGGLRLRGDGHSTRAGGRGGAALGRQGNRRGGRRGGRPVVVVGQFERE